MSHFFNIKHFVKHKPVQTKPKSFFSVFRSLFSHLPFSRLPLTRASFFLFLFLLLPALIIAPIPQRAAYAFTQADLDTVRAKISNLKEKISDYEQKASDLSAKANSLSGQIALLQNEGAKLSAQIKLKKAEHDQLVYQIDVLQKRINDNSNNIGLVLAQYYYSDKISTVERVASAKSFASFVDDEANYSSISDTIAGIITENKNLKTKLTESKNRAELILKDLARQNEVLVQKEQAQTALLNQAKNDEANFRNLRETAENERKALEEQQGQILADLASRYHSSGISAGDPNKGGYPYAAQCPAAQDSFADPWGMYVCECVSYASWRVYHAYGYMPYWGGRGNANSWEENAKDAGYKVSSSPQVGTVAVTTAGPYGHVAWVEAVSGGRVFVSQYNRGMMGQYSEEWVDQGMYHYIYFH